jgi:hypothetical protein
MEYSKSIDFELIFHLPEGGFMGVARFGFVSLSLALLAACGSPSTDSAAPSPPIAVKSDVIVTFDGKRHACFVALPSEPQGSEVACKEIVSFVKDELRVPSGSVYEVRVIPDFDPAERAGVESALKDAGYRFAGGSAPH